MREFDGIIIGGGPAGMFAAITAARKGQNVLLFICSFVGLNAVMEMLASTVVTGALCTALERARLMRR